MQDKIKKIANYYGLSKQIRQLSEECAELIQATSKYMRYQETSYAATVDWKYLQNVCEEIADVEVMLEQIKYLLHINPKAVEAIKGRKVNRQLERIEKEGNQMESKEVFKEVAEALEKQTPKAIHIYANGTEHCPNCDHDITQISFDDIYCSRCGQKLKKGD